MNKADLERKKAHLEEAIDVTSKALNSEEYTKEYQFVNSNPINTSSFSHPMLKSIITKLSEKNLGFNPDLALQHIQKEALDQFNKIFVDEIRGVSVPTLMAIQHEIEKFDMKDRLEHHTAQLKSVNDALKSLEKATKKK